MANDHMKLKEEKVVEEFHKKNAEYMRRYRAKQNKQKNKQKLPKLQLFKVPIVIN
jgi:hypothetical protein